MYLAIHNPRGNINCDVAGPIRYMYLLQLKWASLVVFIDDEQLYGEVAGAFFLNKLGGDIWFLLMLETLNYFSDNSERDLYGEDISLYVNGSNCTTCLYSLNISSARQGRVECGYILKVITDNDISFDIT